MNVFKNVEGKEKTEMKHKIPFQDKGIRQLFAILHQKDSEPLDPSTVQ